MSKETPRVGDIWRFQAEGNERTVYTTGPLFDVNGYTVRWQGVAECIVILPRKRLTERVSTGKDPKADPNCQACRGTGQAGFVRCSCTFPCHNSG